MSDVNDEWVEPDVAPETENDPDLVVDTVEDGAVEEVADEVDDELEVTTDDDEDAEPDRAEVQTELEIERKLRVPALFRMPPVVGADTGVARVVARPPLVLTATYFDTDDLRLARWGVTFRRREGGSDAGWHLKLPVAGGHPGDRDELQLPLDAGTPDSPPRALSDLVSALVRQAPLRAVATLRTERTPLLLRAADDRLIAELVDDVVSVLDGDRVAGRFREIELEAREGSSDDLDRVLAVLMAAGAELGTTSKAAHALGPRATAPPDLPVPTVPSPRDPAWVAVQAHLLTQARRLLLQDVRVRRDLPDAVHQMRVAARRLRSSLRTFRPLVEREWADALREELGWVASELGAIRDTEVLIRRLDEHSALISDDRVANATRALLDRELGARLEAAREEALAALASPRYEELLDRLVDDVRLPPFTDLADEEARKILPTLSWKPWVKLRHEADELDHEVPAEHWHRTRITAKRARYAAEALEPVFGADATALAKPLEAVTEILGEHQDAAIAREIIAELATRPELTGIEGWGLGLLYAIEQQAEADSRIAFIPIWSRALRAHKRSNLH